MSRAIAAASLSLSLAGCCAVHLAPAPTDDEARLLASRGPVGTCVVKGSRVVWDTDDMVRCGLFTEVETDDFLSRGFHPDWCVKSLTEPRPRLHPLYDLWLPTYLTLGLLPTIRIGEETFEYAVWPADEPESAGRRVSLAVPGDEVCGWLSYLLALFPSWSGDFKVESRRFGERLAVELVKTGVFDEPTPAR